MKTRPSLMARRQKGAVLMVSLMILLVLTILSVTALSVVTLEERMARSFQLSDAVFQGAESGISRILHLATADITAGGLAVPNPRYNEDEDRLVASASTCKGTAILHDIDHSPTESIPISTDVQVNYLGETTTGVVGYSLGAGSYVAHYFDINAVSTLGDTDISEDHTQRAFVIRIGTGTCAF